MSEARPTVVFRELYHGYVEAGRRREILHGVSGSVERGESVALLGRSGAGKSTLLNLLAGLARPDRGDIQVAGRDLTGASERERTLIRRRRIGVVYQFFNLIDTLSVEDNVLLPLELDGRVDDAGRARVDELLAAVGLEDRRHSRPDALSGGEQQRVALVRALAHEPELVLADEPTGNLDATTGDTVLDLIDRLVRQTNRSLVLATHNAEVAARADRVVRLDDGRLLDTP
jgi:putative ABC transport system ATP-binding protein